MNVLATALTLVGKRVIVTFADGVREDWDLVSVDRSAPELSVRSAIYPGRPELDTWADYTIAGDDNSSAGAEDVPAIVGIEPWDGAL